MIEIIINGQKLTEPQKTSFLAQTAAMYLVQKMHEAGYSKKKIADTACCSEETVQKFIDELKRRGEYV